MVTKVLPNSWLAESRSKPSCVEVLVEALVEVLVEALVSPFPKSRLGNEAIVAIILFYSV